jgi:hypothetical protein
MPKALLIGQWCEESVGGSHTPRVRPASPEVSEWSVACTPPDLVPRVRQGARSTPGRETAVTPRQPAASAPQPTLTGALDGAAPANHHRRNRHGHHQHAHSHHCYHDRQQQEEEEEMMHAMMMMIATVNTAQLVSYDEAERRDAHADDDALDRYLRWAR